MENGKIKMQRPVRHTSGSFCAEDEQPELWLSGSKASRNGWVRVSDATERVFYHSIESGQITLERPAEFGDDDPAWADGTRKLHVCLMHTPYKLEHTNTHTIRHAHSLTCNTSMYSSSTLYLSSTVVFQHIGTPRRGITWWCALSRVRTIGNLPA